MAKKYVVISSFTYKGQDGKLPQNDWIRIGPGEDVPKLSSDELNRLIMQEKIAELSSETGEIVVNKKLTTLNDAEIERFLRKSTQSVVSAINSGDLSIETLGKMTVIAEREKMDVKIKNALEEKLNEKVSS